jgi:diguanylate cyclase (GGDEF)-like protein
MSYTVRQTLQTRFSLLTTMGVVLLLTVVGLNFDLFLRQQFAQESHDKMRHGFVRLSDKLAQIESQLLDGLAHSRGDESLIASIDLINKYQDKNNYNTFLIDEEKRRLTTQLLKQVKLTFNSQIQLYDVNEELTLFVYNSPTGYWLNYITYDGGERQVLGRHESVSEFSPTYAAFPPGISFQHSTTIRPGFHLEDRLINYRIVEQKLIVSCQQLLTDPITGVSLGYVEMSRLLDPDDFGQLSYEFGVEISFSQGDTLTRTTPLIDVTTQGELEMIESDDYFQSAVSRKSGGETLYFIARLDKSGLKQTLSHNRYRLLVLLVVTALLTLLIMRLLINRGIAEPLRRVMEQIDRIERQDYGRLQTVESGDELEVISKSINNLATVVQDRESELQRSGARMAYLSDHDPLTELPNRRYFFNRLGLVLAAAQQRAGRVAIFFLDLDQFKIVNDTLGHDIGDELLRHVSRRLIENTSEGKTIARIGGDEFTILVEEYHEDNELEALAQHYLDLFQMPFVCFNHQIMIEVSIGISRYPQNGDESQMLVKFADLAMYQAKGSGRNIYSFYSADLSEQVERHATILSNLKLALDDMDGQFELHYQPKVATATGKPVAIEALIRWRREDGYLSPGLFIPVAEESGLIIPLGKWLLHRACHDFARLKQRSIHLDHVSINVSNIQLRDDHLLNELEMILGEGDLLAEQIELEITEGYIAANTRRAMKTLQRFREMGIRLAIDDFGTGYSSMSYLHRLPVTRIKIDKSFVDGIPHCEESVSITRAIISLAKQLSLAVTVEGVEHSDQLELLNKEAVDEIQGFYYAKPMPFDSLVSYLQSALDGGEVGGSNVCQFPLSSSSRQLSL